MPIPLDQYFQRHGPGGRPGCEYGADNRACVEQLTGHRDITIYNEQDAAGQEFLRKLKERGLDSKFLPSVKNPRHFQSGAYHLLGGTAWLPNSWAPISGAEPT